MICSWVKDTLHDGISRVLDKTELIVDDRGMFMEAMKKVWQADVGDSLQTVRRLKQRLTTLNEDKDNLVRSMSKNPELAADFKSTIVSIKAEIASVGDRLFKQKTSMMTLMASWPLQWTMWTTSRTTGGVRKTPKSVSG